MTQDEIRLAVPADPGWARLARLTGAGLASRLGFDYDEVEDVRIAVGEMCSLLMEPSDTPGPLEITFRVTDEHLAVRATAGGDAAPVDATMSEQILDAVVDSYEIGPGTVTVVKRRRASAG